MRFKKNKFIFRFVFIIFFSGHFLNSQDLIDSTISSIIRNEFENSFRDLSRVIGLKVANATPLANSVNYFSSFSLFNIPYTLSAGAMVAVPADNAEKILNAFTDQERAGPFLQFAAFSLPIVSPQALFRFRINPRSANSFFRHPLYVSASASVANLANINQAVTGFIVQTTASLSNFSLSYDFDSFGVNLAYPLLQKRRDFLIMFSFGLGFSQGEYEISAEEINQNINISNTTTIPVPPFPPLTLDIILNGANIDYNLINYFNHVTASLNFNVEARFNKILMGLLGASFIFGNHNLYTTYDADIEVTGNRTTMVELTETIFLPVFKFTPVVNAGLRLFFIDIHFSFAIPDAYLFRLSFSF